MHIADYFIPFSDESVSPVAYAVPVVLVPTIALLVVAVVVVVLIRIRKRKRAHGRSLPQIQSPDTTVSFHKRMTESGQFTPVSLLSPNGANNVYSDPLEFPRNRLHVFTSIVLGMCTYNSWFGVWCLAGLISFSKIRSCSHSHGIVVGLSPPKAANLNNYFGLVAFCCFAFLLCCCCCLVFLSISQSDMYKLFQCTCV